MQVMKDMVAKVYGRHPWTGVALLDRRLQHLDEMIRRQNHRSDAYLAARRRVRKIASKRATTYLRSTSSLWG